MAGRIPQHFIDQLLNRIDIVDLIDSYVPLKKAGANYKACCPFHGEKTPSFTVSPSKQFYHCFGCGENGTAVSFLMNYDHMEFRDAIEKLASSVGLDIPEEAKFIERKKTTSQGIDLYDLLKTVDQFYQTQLRQHADKQQAVDYLKQRGLSGQTAKKFNLGFAPEGWNNLHSAHGTSAPLQKALLDTGMLTNNENGKIYDRFRNRIMFPIHDHRGRIVGFGGRVLGDENPKYLNSPETPVFHKGSELYGLYAARGPIKDADGVLVVEGYMDVVALSEAGIHNAVATLGTATSAMHLQRLFRHTLNVTFCFDGDRAGKAAAWKALETCLPLLEDGQQIKFLFLPDGEDPDTMVKKVGDKAFRLLMDDAMSFTDFLSNQLEQKADLRSLDGSAKLTKIAKPLIDQIQEGVLKKILVERLAKIAGINPNNFSNNKQNTTSQYQGHNKRTDQNKSDLLMSPVHKAISMILQQPNLARLVSNDHGLSSLAVRGISLLIQLMETCQNNDNLSTASLLERHRTESYFSALEKLAIHDHLLVGSETENEFLALIDKLKQEVSISELDQLLDKAQYHTLSDNEKLKLNELLKMK